MANLTLTRQWVENIYQLETSDPVMGGPDGIDNRQAKELGARTNWLKDQVDTINQDLTGYAPKASPAFTGIPTAPTAAAGTNNTQIATTEFVKTAIAALVGSAPAALDTLEELAQALAGETNIKATLLAEIGKKAHASHTHTIAQIDGLSDAINARAPSASPTFSGTVRAPTPAQTVNDTTVATTAYVRAAIAALVGTAPATLDTLSEIANALAGDANVKATLLAEIGKKANASHTHTANQITDFNQATSQIINAAITYQKIGDFEVRKYPDGTMIQTYKKVNPRGITNKWIELHQFNWAVSFIDKPNVWASQSSDENTDNANDNANVSVTINSFVKFNNFKSSGSVCAYWEFNQDYDGAYKSMNWDFLAIGRWK